MTDPAGLEETALWSPGEQFQAGGRSGGAAGNGRSGGPLRVAPAIGRATGRLSGAAARAAPAEPRAGTAGSVEGASQEDPEAGDVGAAAGRTGVRRRGSPVPRHRIRVRRRKPGRPALSQPTGPHIRLGIAWAGVTLGALLLGPGWLDAWLAVVAALAAGSAARSWGTPESAQGTLNNRRARVQPRPAVAAAFAFAVTMSALAGGLVVAVAAATVAVILVAIATFGRLGQPNVARRLVMVLGPGLGAACVVVARMQGVAVSLVLLGMVTVFDSSNYLIGTGAPNRWEGSVAGVASIAALTLFVAAALESPFTGSSPWLLGGAAAVLAPVGPVLARWVTGDTKARVPALRRLDSLFLVAPAWVVGVALLLHR